MEKYLRYIYSLTILSFYSTFVLFNYLLMILHMIPSFVSTINSIVFEWCCI